MGRQIFVTDPQGNTAATKYSTVYTYDAMNRMIMQSTPFEGSDQSVIKYYYDSMGNVTKEKQTDNKPGSAQSWKQTEYQYDLKDHLIKVTEYNGSVPGYTQYYYDKAGNKLRMYTALATPLTITGLDMVSGTTDYSVTKYTYDRFGNLLNYTDPLGQSETYTYDLQGNVLSKTDRNGTIFTNLYDGMNRLLSSKAGLTNLTNNTYTKTGAVAVTANTTCTLTYTYDDLGRLLSETQSGSPQIKKEYTYDIASNRLTAKVYSYDTGILTNDTSYTYDELNRMQTVSEGGVLQCTYTYDVNGNRSSMKYNTNLITNYTYNLSNMLKTLENKYSTVVESSYSYEYQLDGNQTKKTDNTGKMTEYIYDGLGRLKSEKETSGSTILTFISYDYDKAGNRYRMTDKDGIATVYSYDRNNRLLEDNKVSGTTTVTNAYTYDANGNQLSRLASTIAVGTGTQTVSAVTSTPEGEYYEYDTLNRMTRSVTEGGDVFYAYRPDGLRYSKEDDTNTTVHIWDGTNIIGDAVNGSVRTTYVRGVNLIASKTGNTFMYYLYNGHGDVAQLSSSTGDTLWTYDYDAFGNQKDIDGQDAGADVNPFRYCGEYLDLETNTYYLRARNYDPTTGRFLSEDTHWNPSNMIYGDYPVRNSNYQDPLGLNTYTYVPDIYAIRQSSNLYVYCGNNPLMFIDPTGNAWYHWVIGGAIVVAAAAAVVVTAGGAAPALLAVASVAGGTAAATTASTIAAGAFIGSSLVLGASAVIAASNSRSIGEFLDKGNWGTIAYTAGGALAGGLISASVKYLQEQGVISKKVGIDKLINNPKDEFSTLGPKAGQINEWIRIIQQTGNYGKIYVQDLGNGYYMLCDGHHRVAALANLGEKVISVYITK